MRQILELTVKIDFECDNIGYEPNYTAARMVVRDSFPTIESGVKIKSVCVFNGADELFVTSTGVPTTPECYRVSRDPKTVTITVWDECNGVGIRFHDGDTLARYNYEILLKRDRYDMEKVQEVAAMQDVVHQLEDYAAQRWAWMFSKVQAGEELE